jgi:hypothetical protein
VPSNLLAQLARKQAVDHAVPSCSLEGYVGTKKALTDKPAALGDSPRCLIVGTASQFQPGQSQLGECPPSEQADRMSRNTPAASPGGEPVAERRAAPIKASVVQRAAAEHRGLVARPGQREIQLLTTQAGLFLPGEVAARVSLGVLSSSPREPLHHRVTERQQLARHVGLVSGAQQHDFVGQGRHWKPKLSHVEMISWARQRAGSMPRSDTNRASSKRRVAGSSPAGPTGPPTSAMPVRYPGAEGIAAASLDQDTGVVVESIRIWIAYRGLARLAGGQTG